MQTASRRSASLVGRIVSASPVPRTRTATTAPSRDSVGRPRISRSCYFRARHTTSKWVLPMSSSRRSATRRRIASSPARRITWAISIAPILRHLERHREIRFLHAVPGAAHALAHHTGRRRPHRGRPRPLPEHGLRVLPYADPLHRRLCHRGLCARSPSTSTRTCSSTRWDQGSPTTSSRDKRDQTSSGRHRSGASAAHLLPPRRAHQRPARGHPSA